MISPTEIRKKALRQYPTFLSAILSRERFFPLIIKGNKGRANASMDTLYPALRILLENEKKKVGFGYTVTLKSVKTRHAGVISMPDEIYFENVEDFLKFIDKEKEFLAFRSAANQTRKLLPELVTWIMDNPLTVVKNSSIWREILTVGLYFKENPNPRIYARSLPIDVPTTFLEEHKTILNSILTHILSADGFDLNTQVFEEKFGLKYDEPSIRIRRLDDNLCPIFEQSKDIALPYSSWNNQAIDFDQAYLVVDKMDFLRFPDTANSIVIWTSKEALEILPKIKLFHNKSLFYWGDISQESFQILSNLRNNFPQLKSLLMDLKTLKNYQENFKGVKLNSGNIPKNLKGEELMVYELLKEGKKISQKHIKLPDIHQAIAIKPI